MKKQFWKRTAVALMAASAIPTTSWAGDYTQTRYPIVLVHGVFGFDNIGPVEYWYGIPSALRSDGARVFTVQVAATNTTELRGEHLLTQVKQIVAVTGAGKVNLIGHSHGSPTARYVASVRPDLVASVTGVNGVNRGSKVADFLLGIAPGGSLSNSVIVAITDGMSKMIGYMSGGSKLPVSSMGAVTSLSTPGSLKFNAAHPAGIPTTECGEGAYQVRGVHYFSWSGAKPYTNMLDILDPGMALTSLAFGSAKNDGLVSSCSTRLGRVIRDDYAMNHFDAVNQTIGLTNIFETNPVTLYRQHANRLKNLGL